MLGFEIYQGATPNTDCSEKLELPSGLGSTTRVVLSMPTFCGLIEQGHRIYMDNYYTSPELFNQLYYLNTYACGTVRVNRQGMPVAFRKQKRRRDTITLRQEETIFHQQDHLLAIKHHDKRDVHILSTIYAAEETLLDKVDDLGRGIWKPLCIVDYISHMGGVDTADQIMKNYSLLRKTVKWWRKLFFYLFTTALTNAYLLHRKFARTHLSHYRFRIRIARQLIIESPGAPTPTPRGRKCVNPPWRLQGSHVASFNVPEPGAKRKRPPRDCAACNPPKSSRDGFKRKQSIYRCADCDVTLCFPRCFSFRLQTCSEKRARCSW